MSKTIFIALLILFSVCSIMACNGNRPVTAIIAGDTIKLPEPLLKGTMTVEEALHTRRSIRAYKDEALDLATASQLLWSAYGVTKINEKRGLYFKTAPSAGATYPLDVYLLAGKVTGLEQGLYKYIPESHTLILIMKGDFRKELTRVCYNQEMIEQAPLSIIHTAVYERLTKRYGKRGKDRYVCMDLGHSAQNVYLQATALSLGTCAIGAFNDKEFIKLFGLSPAETPLYVMPVGKLKDK